MQKLLIVDDEPLFREGLINTIDWSSLGIEVAGEAFNGKEALTFLIESPVDLVLTDIRMPEMDGLEFIRRAAEIYPGLCFIVLSAYDDFHQVKQAFQLGIVDYILKSEINTAELGDIVRRQRHRIPVLPGDRTSLTSAFADQGRTLFLQQILKNSIERRLAWTDMPDLPEITGTGGHAPVCMAVITLRRTLSRETPEAIGREMNDALTRIEAFLTSREDWIHYRDMQQFVLIRRIRENRSDPGDWQSFGRTTEDLRREIGVLLSQTFPKMSVCAGFADPESHESLWRKKMEAEQSCSYSFFRGPDRTIASVHYRRSLDYPAVIPEAQFRAFSQLFEKRDWNGLRREIPAFQLLPLRCRGADLDEAENLFRRYYYFLNTLTGRLGMAGCPEILEALERFKSLEASKAVLEEYNGWLREVLLLICAKGENRFKISHRVIDFLEKNYARDVSLATVADALELNSSYVSRIFSRETGSGFNHYLLQFRIGKAIELMEQSPDKMYEIAEKVGFANPESFCRGFKKITGVSPGKYCQKK